MAGRGAVVGRRRVFYIPGYDPFPPRRYRELYRREGERQAALAGYDLALGPGQAGPASWSVRAVIEDERVEAEVEVLVWSDLVQDSMGHGIPATYGQLLRTAWAYIGSGALFRLMRLRKGPVIAALYPIGMLLAQLGLALAAARAAGAAIGLALAPPWPWLGLLAVWPVLAGFRRLDRHLYAYYLMHDYAHTAQAGGAYPPELEARLAAFGDRIAAALGPEADEVLVVGHSSGAHLAVSVLADLIRQGRVPAEGPALSLLTLGHVVPMVSFLPRADRLRADLHFLSARDELAWVDVTAPGDGCAFALCDPVAVTGVAPEGRRWPLVISAAFSRTLRPETWARLRWRFFRLHFQYLCAFDGLRGGPGEYDYFRITAGPQTLGQRFAGRPPSKSRIEAPASRYTSMAA
ncbi:MAG: hypothetical protein N2Z62_09765 [Rhodobacteraceae bacterium]|nr:hypothetical protein [Paracoccaceae bacterium]